MLFRPVAVIVAILAAAPSVSANGLSLAINEIVNFGCSGSSAPSSVKSQCTVSGSFYLDVPQISGTLCVSIDTKTSPSGITCPFSWDMHKTAKCCVPQTEVSPCDCGEGYAFGTGNYKCGQNTSPSCSDSQWYHQRSSSCCENSWSTSPPSGSCPSGITCPSEWFWHTGYKQCRPKSPRSPEPDCSNWDNNNMCCGSGSSPSQGSSNGGGYGGHGGYGRKGKRDFALRQQQTFPQSEIDAMYCPGSLHACTVPTSSGSWAWECIDVATELESCGGCLTSGAGVDCSSIPHAKSVGCSAGVCEVYTCHSGYVANGTACALA